MIRLGAFIAMFCFAIGAAVEYAKGVNPDTGGGNNGEALLAVVLMIGAITIALYRTDAE